MKKKILFIVQLPPPVHGVSLRNQSLVESNLLQEKFEIKLAPLSFADTIESIGKASAKKIFKMFRYAFSLIGTMISFNPQLAYFTITPAGWAFYRDCLFVSILKLFRVKIIYHLHGFGIKESYNKNFINRILLRFAFKNASVICLGKNQLPDIEGLPYKKHFIIPNGVKIESISASVIDHGDKKKLLFLSNFVKSKGVYDLVEALEKLNHRDKNFEASFVGEEFNITKAELKNFIDSKGLGDKVKILEPHYREEKSKAISDCDIFILPTYFDLFPSVLLEAMQCGKPIISTFTGAIPEIIDSGINGILVEPRNTDQLAEKISYLVNNPGEAALLGKNAKEKFFAKFTLEKFEQNMEAVYQEVLSPTEILLTN